MSKKVIRLTEGQLKKIIENTILKENENIRPITQDEIEYFNYLNELRGSGETNMFGARPYLERNFGLSKQEATNVLSTWMKNFNEEGYDENTIIKEK